MAKLSRNRKIAVAIGAGGIAAGVLAASAASLGGLTVQNLGANNAVIAACNGGTGITITGWDPSYSVATSGAFNVSQLLIQGATASCSGHPYKIVVANSAGTSLGSGTGTINNGTSYTAALSPAVNAEAATQVTLTIY